MSWEVEGCVCMCMCVRTHMWAHVHVNAGLGKTAYMVWNQIAGSTDDHLASLHTPHLRVSK